MPHAEAAEVAHPAPQHRQSAHGVDSRVGHILALRQGSLAPARSHISHLSTPATPTRLGTTRSPGPGAASAAPQPHTRVLAVRPSRPLMGAHRIAHRRARRPRAAHAMPSPQCARTAGRASRELGPLRRRLLQCAQRARRRRRARHRGRARRRSGCRWGGGGCWPGRRRSRRGGRGWVR